jgi:hypothetical protein
MGIQDRDKLGMVSATLGRVSKRTVLTMFLALVAVGSARIYAGVNVWTSHGPEGGYVNGPPVIDPQDPNTLYSTEAYGRLFKSTDATTNWSALSPARPVAVDPQNSRTLYGTSLNGGFIKHERRSELECGEPPPGSPQDFVWLLVIDPRDPGALYAVNQTGLFESTDGRSNLGELEPATAYVAIAPEGTIYLVTASGLFKSGDSGATWNVVTNSGLTSSISALAVDPLNPNHLFAGTYDGGVFEITLVEE